MKEVEQRRIQTLKDMIKDYDKVITKMAKDENLMRWEDEHPDLSSSYKYMVKERNAVAWAVLTITGGAND